MKWKPRCLQNASKQSHPPWGSGAANPPCKKAKGLGSGGAVAPGVGTATVGMDGIGVAMGAGMGIGGDAGTGPHHLD